MLGNSLHVGGHFFLSRLFHGLAGFFAHFATILHHGGFGFLHGLHFFGGHLLGGWFFGCFFHGFSNFWMSERT